MWLERPFAKEEVRAIVFDLEQAEHQVQMAFLWIFLEYLIYFFQNFWEDVKGEVMCFMSKFNERGSFVLGVGALEDSFIAFFPKKA